MSYRSIKTVLGETSLERKCRFLFGASLLVLITASFWWYGTQTGKLVYEQNRNTGRLLVEEEIFKTHWWPSERKESSQNFVDILKHLVEHLRKQKHTITYIDPRRPAAPRGPKTSLSGNSCAAFSGKSPTRRPTPTTPSSASGRCPR